MNQTEKMIGTHQELFELTRIYGLDYSDGNKEDFMELVDELRKAGIRPDPKALLMYDQFKEELSCVNM